MSELKTLITEAQHQLRTYRSPDTGAVEEKLEELLAILNRGSLKYDRITLIQEEDDELVINTEYSLRCCAMTGEYKIPMSIINSTDPVKAAHRWLKEQELAEKVENLKSYRDALVSAQAQVKNLPTRITALETELEEFKRSLT